MINRLFLLANASEVREIERTKSDPMPFQRECLKMLVRHSAGTSYGSKWGMDSILRPGRMGYDAILKEFQRNMPVVEYDTIAPYITLMRQGMRDVLWDEPVRWYAKSSGTSSDKSKFIPVTPMSLRITHYGGFRRMMAWYVHTHPQSRLFSGKSLTLGGSVKIDEWGGADVKNGDLSAILLSNSPLLAELFRSPSRKSALISDFNEKLEVICHQCSRLNVTNFSGVPSWNLMLIKRLLEYNNASNLLEIWPNLQLFMHGGIGFEPYREIYSSLIPSPQMHYLENYNASEGYFAFQDDLENEGMLLTAGNGNFYEFVPVAELDDLLAGRKCELLTLEGVKKGVNYALVISAVNGLFRYVIGDCVEFVSLYPHRIKIAGRTKLCINAFGEELMIGNAERALTESCRICGCSVAEFTVAPVFMKGSSGEEGLTKGRHKWVVEFGWRPQNLQEFAKELDYQLTLVNSDYEAKRAGNATMEQLELVEVPEGTFSRWMERRGKLGGQNKVPRLWHNQDYLMELLR